MKQYVSLMDNTHDIVKHRLIDEILKLKPIDWNARYISILVLYMRLQQWAK